jgi:serine protease Do
LSRPIYSLAGTWRALSLAAALAMATLPAAARSAPDGFADLTEKLLPAVVNISTTQTVKERSPAGPGGPQRGPGGQGPGPEVPQFPPGSPFEEFFKDFFDRNTPRGGGGARPEVQPRRATSLGSGFIIDPAGLIVTNNHVISDADEINVILQDDTTLKAEVVGKDAKTDIALLRVKTDKQLSAVPLGDSDQIRVGDWVLAIGNPFGLGGTVTAGILSAHHRDIQAGPYDDFLQTDASINRGNSGGPMFNTNGEVIGINTAIFSPMASGGSVGIGFAIPSNMAKSVVAQLKDHGRARRGWLGVRIQGVTDDIAESIGLDKPRGALIASVSDKGPAQVAGIQAGDVVLTFDGKDVTDMRRLPKIVAETPIDKSVKVTIWRKKKEQSFDVKVGELQETEQQAALQPNQQQQPAQPPGSTVKALGLSLASASPELKQKFSLADETSGVVITEVAGDSPAAEKGIRPGDVIIEVAQEEVKDPAKVAQKVDEARKAGRKSILMLVDRAGDLRFVALRIDQG